MRSDRPWTQTAGCIEARRKVLTAIWTSMSKTIRMALCRMPTLPFPRYPQVAVPLRNSRDTNPNSGAEVNAGTGSLRATACKGASAFRVIPNQASLPAGAALSLHCTIDQQPLPCSHYSKLTLESRFRAFHSVRAASRSKRSALLWPRVALPYIDSIGGSSRIACS